MRGCRCCFSLKFPPSHILLGMTTLYHILQPNASLLILENRIIYDRRKHRRALREGYRCIRECGADRAAGRQALPRQATRLPSRSPRSDFNKNKIQYIGRKALVFCPKIQSNYEDDKRRYTAKAVYLLFWLRVCLNATSPSYSESIYSASPRNRSTMAI